MYMAIETIGGQHRYAIRESYPKGPYLLSRDLFDCGTDPGRYIVYPGGRSYYIEETVEDRLRALNVVYDASELDELFFPFIDPEIRWKLEWMDRRRCRREKSFSREYSAADYHRFDRSRMHFLRTGAANQGQIGRMPVKMLRVLAEKSRDEIEQHFMRMERRLNPREIKKYVFVIFDLQRFFASHYATAAPEMLSQKKVDEHFVQEICRLNADHDFWSGMPAGRSLHAYLTRYVVMYFDHDYGQGRFLDQVIRDFINRRRRYRPPRSVRVRLAHAAALFDTGIDALKHMSRAELARLFRRRAQKLHPDKGGDHDTFVKLVAAYHALLRRKTG